MSYQVTAWVVGKKTGSSSGKALLLAIANYAQTNGETYQSISQLAKDTEQSKDSVRRRLVELEEMGLIARCARWAESGRRLSDWIVVLYCEEAYEFARSQGWSDAKTRLRDASAPCENDAAEEAESGGYEADESGRLPSQIATPTLANCEGGGSTGARVTLATVLPPNKENSNRTVKDSLSPDGEADGCAVREREIVYEKIDPLSEAELEDWKKFHERWGWNEKESPIVARGVFRRMSREDRALALRYVGAYRAEHKGKAIAYAGNWLKQRGWEVYVEREAKRIEAKAQSHERQRQKYGGILIWQGTPQAAAWARHDGCRLKFERHGPFNDTVVKPSEWPPSASHAEAARDGPSQPERRV